MKVLPIARVLLVDSDSARLKTTRDGLLVLGVGSVAEAGSLTEASNRGLFSASDVVVVQVGDADGIPEVRLADLSGIPALLMVETASPLVSRLAMRAGFDAIIPGPVSARLLYRRIGSVLQRARRDQRQTARPAAAPIAEHAAAP